MHLVKQSSLLDLKQVVHVALAKGQDRDEGLALAHCQPYKTPSLAGLVGNKQQQKQVSDAVCGGGGATWRNPTCAPAFALSRRTRREFYSQLGSPDADVHCARISVYGLPCAARDDKNAPAELKGFAADLVRNVEAAELKPKRKKNQFASSLQKKEIQI